MQLVGGVAALGLSALLVALPASAEKAWVRGEVRLNLRSGPGNQYRILEVIKTGDSMQILRRDEGWTMVQTPAGQTSGMADLSPVRRERNLARNLVETYGFARFQTWDGTGSAAVLLSIDGFQTFPCEMVAFDPETGQYGLVGGGPGS